jgi:hypothetical protein
MVPVTFSGLSGSSTCNFGLSGDGSNNLLRAFYTLKKKGVLRSQKRFFP